MKRKRYTARRHRRLAPINKRFRQIWVDGFGLLPQNATEKQLEQTREAMRSLAVDDEYWDKLRQLISLKHDVDRLRKELVA